LEETADSVRLAGRYQQVEIPALMSQVDWVVVPSIWWENAPMVIQEALSARRPVICSDVGGMAEKIQPGVNGLHFRLGDPFSLADTIRYAIGNPELWDKVLSQIADQHSISEHVSTLAGMYNELMRRRAPVEAAAAW